MAPDPRIAEFLARNKTYASNFTPAPDMAAIRASVGSRPPQISIISCSDPRLIPEEFFNFSRLEATVTRNAGGRAMDALRSLVVLDALAPIGTVIVVHHTDCGLTHLSDNGIREALKERAPSKAEEIKGLEFGEIKNIDQDLLDDVAIIKKSPYLAKDLLVLGYVYDMETGLLREVTSG